MSRYQDAAVASRRHHHTWIYSAPITIIGHRCIAELSVSSANTESQTEKWVLSRFLKSPKISDSTYAKCFGGEFHADGQAYLKGVQPGQRKVRRRRRSKTATWATAVDQTHDVDEVVRTFPVENWVHKTAQLKLDQPADGQPMQLQEARRDMLASTRLGRRRRRRRRLWYDDVTQRHVRRRWLASNETSFSD